MTNKPNKLNRRKSGKKHVKVRKQRAQSLVMKVCRTKVSTYWHPIPFDKKDKLIPSCVDCLYHQDYYSRGDAADMLRSL